MLIWSSILVIGCSCWWAVADNNTSDPNKIRMTKVEPSGNHTVSLDKSSQWDKIDYIIAIAIADVNFILTGCCCWTCTQRAHRDPGTTVAILFMYTRLALLYLRREFCHCRWDNVSKLNRAKWNPSCFLSRRFDTAESKITSFTPYQGYARYTSSSRSILATLLP